MLSKHFHIFQVYVAIVVCDLQILICLIFSCSWKKALWTARGEERQRLPFELFEVPGTGRTSSLFRIAMHHIHGLDSKST